MQDQQERRSLTRKLIFSGGKNETNAVARKLTGQEESARTTDL